MPNATRHKRIHDAPHGTLPSRLALILALMARLAFSSSVAQHRQQNADDFVHFFKIVFRAIHIDRRSTQTQKTPDTTGCNDTVNGFNLILMTMIEYLSRDHLRYTLAPPCLDIIVLRLHDGDDRRFDRQLFGRQGEKKVADASQPSVRVGAKIDTGEKTALTAKLVMGF